MGIKTMKTIHNAERGFSLIEIMVALTISLILMAGVLAIMSSSKRTYLLQNELGQLQENARFVIDDISYNLRMAGFYGCSNTPPSGANTLVPIDGVNNSAVLVAFRDANDEYLINPDLKTANANKNEPPSDILEISTFGKSTDLCDTTNNPKAAQNILQLGTPSNTTVYLPNADYPIGDVGDSIILSDCGGSRVYTIAARNGDAVEVENSFQRTFTCPVDAFKGEGETIRYEVRAINKDDNTASATDPHDGFALFRTDPSDPDGKMRLFVDGVESLQVRLGIDTDPSEPRVADKFIELPSTDAAVPTGDIVSVRISLLMRTPNFQNAIPDITNPDEYAFVLDPASDTGSLKSYKPMKVNLANEDGYRHRVFTTTIQVRN